MRKQVPVLPKIMMAACMAAGMAGPVMWTPGPAKAQTVSDAGSDRSALDALTWRGASSADTAQAYRAYLAEFPEGLFSDLASDKLQSLQAPAVAEPVQVLAIERAEPVRQAVEITAPNPLPDNPAEKDASPPETNEGLETEIPASAATVAETAETGDLEADRSATTHVAGDMSYFKPDGPVVRLPEMPSTPELAKDGYPDCRENYKDLASLFDRIDAINRCTIMIDVYYLETLNVYRERMIQHQNEISEIYTSKVAGKVQYAGKRHDAFYAAMMKEHAASNPDGEHLAYYRSIETQYQSDRGYLEDRYCFHAGCNGYEMPDFNFAFNSSNKNSTSGDSGNNDKKKKKPRSRKKCKTARLGGGFLGGLIGGLGAKALGLGKIGTLIAGGAGAALGSELACQLSEKEQEVAAEATVKIVEEEQVGATAEWISPERKGVSGSSTITALNAQPNGSTCLDITDVAIIDGEETSIAKRMCRAPGQSRYTVMA